MEQVDKKGIETAFAEAKKSYDEGGIPVGASLLVTSTGELKGQGHNERVQKSSPILHGETACLANCGRLTAAVLRSTTLYTTLSPCDMCTGAILLYKIPRVVICENTNFKGAGEDYLRARGVEVVNLDISYCKELMAKFIQEKPEIWNEDIGEPI